jgi:GNAT superfamily N-acetyltransferase
MEPQSKSGTIFSIRLLSPSDDLNQLHQLLRKAYGDLSLRCGVAYWAAYQDLETTRTRVSKGDCYVASIGDRYAGTITLYRKEYSVGTPWFEKPRVTSFGLFAVDPDFQGIGLGKALIKKAEDRSREWGMTELSLDTCELLPDSVKMYESLGYRFVEFVHWPQDTFRSVVLSKSLSPAPG